MSKPFKILLLVLLAAVVIESAASANTENAVGKILYQYAVGDYYSAKMGVDGTFGKVDARAVLAFRKQRKTLEEELPKLPLEERKIIAVMFFFFHGGLDGEACTRFCSLFLRSGQGAAFDRQLVVSLLKTPDKNYTEYCHHMNVDKKQVKIFRDLLRGVLEQNPESENQSR
jgi:hypothetical protein